MKRFRWLLWTLWIFLITFPLIFFRAQYDWDTETWVAKFRSDRWFGLWNEAPRWIIQHWIDLLLAVVFVGIAIGFAKLWQLPAWGRFRERIQTQRRGKWTQTFLCIAIVLLLVWCSRNLRATHLEWAVMACMYMVLAMGLNITVGMTGLLVLGYAGFMATGAYTFAVLHEYFEITIWTAFVPAALVGGVLGFLVGLPSIRLRGDYLAIVTLGFGETARFLIKNLVGEQSIVITRDARVPALMSENGLWRWLFPEGLKRLQVELWIAVAMVLISLWLVRNLACSRVGRAWIAIREDETAAVAMGIPTVRLKLLAFTLSAMWASVGGVFFVAHNTSANPEMFGFPESVLILSMVVLGGMGSGPGPIIGALVLYLIPEVLRERLPALISYRPMFVGGLMVAMMIYRPQGLMGSLRRRIQLVGPKEDVPS